ncbi:MAG: NAD(P)/FAD-dependent oxidoreductase [Candidatus Heimdallarchaeota archaeon]|nr:NAD(P)/FAD-dependent oxidoreductase [Candidatus Heimdallarchaeota archaeon]
MIINTYDVIIIGSGMGGLGAGLALQTHNPNLKTIILEQHSIPGGFVTGFKRKGIYFDAGAEGIIYAEENQALSQTLQKLGVDQEFIKIDPLEVLYYPDKEITIHAKPEKFLDELIKHFPDSESELRSYFEIMEKMTEELWYYGPTDYTNSLWTLLKFFFRAKTIRKHFLKSFQKYLDKKISNVKLHPILSFYNLWLGLPPKDVMAPIGVVVGGNPFLKGNFYPRGGMLSYAMNLASYYNKKGGEIRYSAKVEQIVVVDKTAVGVKLTSGEEIRAKLIISNADLKQTYLKLLGKKIISKKDYTKMVLLEPSISGFGVFLGVDMDLTNFPSHLTIFNDYEEIIAPVLEGNFTLNGVAMRIPSKIDDSLKSDKGTGIVMLAIAPYDWKNKWQVTLDGDRAADYMKLKEEYAEQMIKIAERAIPGLSENIIVKEIATPITFERYSLNDGGGWYGPQKGQRRSSYKYPLDNLILTGANVDSTGVPTAFISGVKTAEKIIRKRKL